MVSRLSRLPSKQGSLRDQSYVHCLPNGFLSSPNLLADVTSIFSVVKDHLNFSNKLTEDL